jgi:hypothetical protein
MREVVSVIFGVAVALIWAAIWTGLLHVLGVAPVNRKVEDPASTRERLKRLGKLKYIVIFGVLGPGVAVGLAMITIDFAGHRSTGWLSELIKLVLFAVVFGLIRGLGIGTECFVIRSRFHLSIHQQKTVDVTSR